MWAIYALLSAFFVSATDPIAKKALGQNGDEYTIGLANFLFSVPFLAVLFFSHKVAPLNPGLIKTLLAVIPFEILAAVLYYRALRLTDISLSVPFLALTPVFVLATGYILLGERISIGGAIGTILIAVGAYSLHFDKSTNNLIHPFKTIFRNKGSLLMIAVSMIFAITAVVSKKAMLFSSPEAIPFLYNLTVGAAFLPIVLYRLANGKSKITRPYKTLFTCFLMGFLSSLSVIFYFKSIALASVAYAVSIKRLSLLMSVGYGWLVFRERDIHLRLASTFCMILGVILITLNS